MRKESEKKLARNIHYLKSSIKMRINFEMGVLARGSDADKGDLEDAVKEHFAKNLPLSIKKCSSAGRLEATTETAKNLKKS